MRRAQTFLYVGVIAAGLLPWTSVVAQTSQFASTSTEDERPVSAFTRSSQKPEKRLDRMTKHFKLNDDQKRAILPILQDQRSELQALRADGNLSRDDKTKSVDKIRDEGNAKIYAILDDKQQVKWNKDLEKHHEF